MLHEFQREFGRALRRGDSVPAAIESGHHARFAIYRQSFLASLVETLSTAFPVVRKLVGPAFFTAVAQKFVADYPPEKPRLSLYGTEFPAYLATVPEAAGLGYLPDLARLEWAHVESYFAPAPDKRIDPHELIAGVDKDASRLRFEPSPSLRLVAAQFAIYAIWRAHQEPLGGQSLADIDPAKPESVRLVGDGQFVRLARLDPAAHAFVASLASGHALGHAQEHALGIDQGFDIAPVLAAELKAGSFIALNQAE
jgi:hypothetical protein